MTRGIPHSEEASSRRDFRSALFRQVSQEALAEEDVTAVKLSRNDGRGSPARCVSEFDRAAMASRSIEEENDCEENAAHSQVFPPFFSPVNDPILRRRHVSSIRLEVELHPFRLILSRLMAHPTLNRKGIFNAPVDPVALNLPDYFTIITKPMDLGSVRTRLHALEFSSRDTVVEDIRLVFRNAMKYNPPTNAVHSAARELLEFFEDQLKSFLPEFDSNGLAISGGANVQSVQSVSSRGDPTLLNPLLTRQSGHGIDGVLTGDDGSHTKRMKRGTKKNHSHSCQWCQGRKCAVCLQGCLQLEPCLLICNGPQCSGSRIRKGAVYYIAPDGSRQYCERCHTGLPAVLPRGASDEVHRYKRDLLKRKNDEEVVESWLSCNSCHSPVHKVCAMFNEYAEDEADFVCGECKTSTDASSSNRGKRVSFATHEIYSYVSGSTHPVPLEELTGSPSSLTPWTAERLPHSCISAFIQEKVRDQLKNKEYPNADKTVFVRLISDCDKHFKVPAVVRNHFRIVTGIDETQPPPLHVEYKSKAIALFQKTDGQDICIFCMYVQEYQGNGISNQNASAVEACTDKKRVYIAYLDSVEHFRPRQLRTSIYHEILVSYLATARARGFEFAHIWACPPSRGNSFVFWNYPSSQRTPTRERLIAWYHEALVRALDQGVVTDVKSLYETNFMLTGLNADDDDRADSICPPILDGDYWIEEAIRLHSIHVARCLKARTADGCIPSSSHEQTDSSYGRCPALEIATFLRKEIISEPVALFFRKPVNAAALNLTNYHKIIKNPMDLGSIYARCLLGEYPTLKDLVNDFELVVSNAKKFNPPGHPVHVKADELRSLFFKKLNLLVKDWPSDEIAVSDWTSFHHLSLRLDGVFASDTTSTASVVSASARSLDSIQVSSVTVAELLSGGAAAIEKRMVGNDTWLLEKKPMNSSGKGSGPQKKSQCRRRKNENSGESEPTMKRRRQAWLAEEVGSSIRRLRQSFFSCDLKAQGSSLEQEGKFAKYAESFSIKAEDDAIRSTLADARHALLEFSQFRNLQFDTLRRAKYSTAVLLYHLHNPQVPGITPSCNGCGVEIREVRWHKVGKVVETRRAVSRSAPPHLLKKAEPSVFIPEELCQACFSSRTDQTDFIPIPVSCSPL